ncbi:glycoside hydrolase, partial [Bacteroidales bacterium OttesenSCG-928-M06]|nr:glycoside hydrolase [Bacteroidales bacterium OttesenSCG-928-M06]
EKPVDVTSQVYGPGCTNSVTKSWLAAFPTSGSILQKRDGTLVVAMLGRNAQDQKVVHLALSKDGGKTWYAAKGNGTTNPDESKVVEKNNGDLILSVRASGENYKNITSDDGETWKLPAQTRYTGVKNAYCNGDFKLLTSTLDGNDKNRMLHTNCFANSRMNVSAVISYDEGNTWSSPKTICPRSSAYSALTILPDGTIGCYYEEGGLEGGYIMRYVRFSVDWLTGGEDDITSYYPVGYKGVAINNPMIEDNSFCVTSENGIISVTGATDYTITSLLGVNIPKGIGLNKGIYVVTANGKSVKTIVR